MAHKTYNPGRRLPNIPSTVDGVVKWGRDNKGSIAAAFQCYDCHLVEEPYVAVTTTLVFHALAGDGKRRCKPCRIKRREIEYPDCICHLCKEDTA